MSTTTKHESFGLIRTVRVEGGGNDLVGTTTETPRRIRLEILRGKMEARYSTNRMEEENSQPLISLEMSPEQYALFVSGMGQFPGTECTIRSFAGTRMANPPKEFTGEGSMEASMTQSRNDIHELNVRTVEKIQAVKDAIQNMKMSKRDQETLMRTLSNVTMELNENAPFLAQIIDEKIDKGIARAQAEIQASTAIARDTIYSELARAVPGTTQNQVRQLIEALQSKGQALIAQ